MVSFSILVLVSAPGFCLHSMADSFAAKEEDGQEDEQEQEKRTRRSSREAKFVAMI